MYEQAGSVPGTFIESRPFQDTLGEYFFQWDSKKVANWVMFFNDFASNTYFDLFSEKLQIGFSEKGLAKKVLNSGFKLLF